MQRLVKKGVENRLPMTFNRNLSEKSVLLLDPDPWVRDSLALVFSWKVGRFVAFDNAEDGHRAIDSHPFDIVICAHGSPGLDGLSFLGHCRDAHPDAIRILIGALAAPRIAVDGKPPGIHAWIQKPLTIESVEKVLWDVTRPCGKETADALA